MYESNARRRREEVQLHNAARIIQHRFRQFLARKEDEQERKQFQENPSTLEAGGNREQDLPGEEEKSDEEKLLMVLEEYGALLAERERIVDRNLEAQRVAAKYFMHQRIRKGESKTGNPVTPEFEEAYWGAVRRLGDERCRLQAKKKSMEDELDQQRAYYQSTIDEALRQEDAFRHYIRDTSTAAVFMRATNGAFPPALMDDFMEKEQEQRHAIQSARVRLIQLQNFLKKLHRSANEDHSSGSNTNNNPNNGMYLIDFEQLKIENTNLNEKIEERNEDLVKLRRKVTTTIHVLTHVKEKLEFMKAENTQLRQQVQITEEELSGVRDQLAQTKRRRDGFLKANLKMKEKMPLVGMEDLLMDYEMRKSTIDRTRVKVVSLTERHRELLDEIERQLPVLGRLRREISRYPVT